MPFDSESGQVFDEVLIRPRGPRLRSLSRVYNYPIPDAEYPPTGLSRGPRSLLDMTLSLVAGAIDEVEGDCVERLPGRLLVLLWRVLEKTGMSLHAWKILQKLVFQEADAKVHLADYHPVWHLHTQGNSSCYRTLDQLELLVPSTMHREGEVSATSDKCRGTPNLNFELSTLVQSLASPSVDFIAHLVISMDRDMHFTVNEMFALTDMKNLGVLELWDLRRAGYDLASHGDSDSHSHSHWIDEFIRGCSEKDDPFPLLRALVVRGDACTAASLRHLSRFPALAVFDVFGHRAGWKTVDSVVREVGWELAARDKRAPLKVQDSPNRLDKWRERLSSGPLPTLEELVMYYLGKNPVANSLAESEADPCNIPFSVFQSNYGYKMGAPIIFQRQHNNGLERAGKYDAEDDAGRYIDVSQGGIYYSATSAQNHSNHSTLPEVKSASTHHAARLLYDALGLLIHNDKDLRARAVGHIQDRQQQCFRSDGNLALPPLPMMSTYLGRCQWAARHPVGHRPRSYFAASFLRSAAFRRGEGEGAGTKDWDPTLSTEFESDVPPRSCTTGKKRKAKHEIRASKRVDAHACLASFQF